MRLPIHWNNVYPRPPPLPRSRHRLARWLPALLLVVIADTAWAEPGAPPTSPLLVAPRTIEHSAKAEVLLRLPAGPAVTLRASSGTLEPPTQVKGAWVARYRPADPIEPGAVIFHAVAEPARSWLSTPRATARCGGTWVLTRRTTRAVHTIRTKPLTVVAIYVGGRPAGSATADKFGRATVTTPVEPEDTTYEIRAQDRLKNENARTMELPASVGPPPLLAEACQESVRAGESVMVEVAAVDRHAHPVKAEWITPLGVTVDTVELSGFLGLYRVNVSAEHEGGPVELALRNDNAQTSVHLAVTPLPRSARADDDRGRVEAERARRPPGALLGANAGAASNLSGRWGLSTSVHLDYRPHALYGRLRPRLVLGCAALWQSTTTIGPATSTTNAGAALRSSVEVLAAPLELGLGATLLRTGAWELDLEAGAGGAWVRVQDREMDGTSIGTAGSTAMTRAGLFPTVSAGLALRRRAGRGTLVARAGWRQIFRTTDTTTVEAGDNRGLLDVTLGGELDL